MWKDYGNSIFLPSVKAMIESNIIFCEFCYRHFYLFLLRQVKEHPIEAMVWTHISIIKSIETDIYFFISRCYLFLRVIEAFRRACGTWSTIQHNAPCCVMFHNTTQCNMLRRNVANGPWPLILLIPFSALVSPPSKTKPRYMILESISRYLQFHRGYSNHMFFSACFFLTKMNSNQILQTSSSCLKILINLLFSCFEPLMLIKETQIACTGGVIITHTKWCHMSLKVL